MWGAQIDKHLCSTSTSDFDLLPPPNPTSPTPPLRSDTVADALAVEWRKVGAESGEAESFPLVSEAQVDKHHCSTSPSDFDLLPPPRELQKEVARRKYGHCAIGKT